MHILIENLLSYREAHKFTLEHRAHKTCKVPLNSIQIRYNIVISRRFSSVLVTFASVRFCIKPREYRHDRKKTHYYHNDAYVRHNCRRRPPRFHKYRSWLVRSNVRNLITDALRQISLRSPLPSLPTAITLNPLSIYTTHIEGPNREPCDIWSLPRKQERSRYDNVLTGSGYNRK